MLVTYSDSEGSEDEQPKPIAAKPSAKPPVPPSNSNFAIDRSTGRIKINLQDKPVPTSNDADNDEPAPKRPRIGGSNAFSGFNAMLPAPKRDNLPASQTAGGANKTAPRKVFSLRTGAEPAFSRESDAELRELFAEQNTTSNTMGLPKQSEPKPTIPSSIPKPSFAKPAPPAPAGKAFMFKPLSVARNGKKKKPTTTTPQQIPVAKAESTSITTTPQVAEQPKKEKINLFSAGTDNSIPSIPPDEEDDFENEDDIIEDLGPAIDAPSTTTNQPIPQSQSQSLHTIANDLNLTASQRRQLFGRQHQTSSSSSASAINVINFNTDAEYAANQSLIANGESVQHNPVRAIGGGKHSLKSLMSSAVGQKEALEESFASGKRNRREAGSKYGW